MDRYTFGEALRRYRQQAGLTQTCLAKQVDWSQSQVCRAEKNRTLPSPHIVDRLDELLAAGGKLQELYRQAIMDRSIVGGRARRRLVIGAAGAAAATAALTPFGLTKLITELDTKPGKVTHADAAAIEEITHDLYMRDLQLGGASVHQMVLATLRWALGFLDGSFTPDIRQRLHRAIAMLAELAGWTVADTGDLTTAGQLYRLGLHHARITEDHGMLTHLITSWARILTHHRRSRDALTLMQAATLIRRRALPPAGVALLDATYALTHARAGNSTFCHRYLDRAERIFRAPQADDPFWAQQFTAPQLSHDIGTSLFYLARSSGRLPNDTLLDRLADAAASYPDTVTRHKAMACARLAAACYTLGDVERANHAARQALSLAHRVRSIRVADEVTALVETTTRYRHNPEVQDILHEAQQVLARYPARQATQV